MLLILIAWCVGVRTSIYSAEPAAKVPSCLYMLTIATTLSVFLIISNLYPFVTILILFLSFVFIFLVDTAVTLKDPATHHSGCGVTKGCYSIPNGCPEPSCQYNVEFTKRGDVIDFEVSAQIPPELGTDVYLCLGFNNQRKMVRICRF